MWGECGGGGGGSWRTGRRGTREREQETPAEGNDVTLSEKVDGVPGEGTRREKERKEGLI